jgi:GntR family transcriptional regulator
MINFSVEFKSGVPIYEQVIFAAKKAIVSGHYKPGDRFPSVRELSREFRINPNTAQKVITYLVREKLLEMQPGIGSVVAELREGNRELQEELLGSEVEQLVVEAKRLSIKKKELIQAINRQWGRNKK